MHLLLSVSVDTKSDLKHRKILLFHRESNTRLVKWSDGTFQLHVANDVYEVSEVPSKQGLD